MMNAHRLYTASRRRRKVYLQKVVTGFCGIAVVLFLSVLIGSNFAAAHGSREEDPVVHKYYKSIEIVSGDTLWGIAEKYADTDDVSITEYIREIKEINELSSDDIHDSRFLTIAYHDTAFK